MQDLQLIGVHEDGEHLLLRGADDGRFQMPVDESLRAAVRRDRPHLGQQPSEVGSELRPRDIQSLIRAGVSADEVASRAGWPVEKVHRYEGPILAEREHVAGLAQGARLRSPTNVSSGGSTHTLSARVAERLKSRDVEATDASWDSWRNDGGPWTIVLTFAAGGRQRQASWSFDLADRTVTAVDDEARWLSEEVREAKGPIPAPKLRPASGRDAAVYDVEAEGGLQPTPRTEHTDDPLDLMSAMRKRSTARGRRKSGGRSSSSSPAGRPKTESQTDIEPEAALIELPEEHLTLDDPAPSDTTPSDTTPSDTTPSDTTAGLDQRLDEPAEESADRSRTKTRPRRPVREAARKTGRPSVPAWDEIMFGSRPGVDRSSS